MIIYGFKVTEKGNPDNILYGISKNINSWAKVNLIPTKEWEIEIIHPKQD